MLESPIHVYVVLLLQIRFGGFFFFQFSFSRHQHGRKSSIKKVLSIFDVSDNAKQQQKKNNKQVHNIIRKKILSGFINASSFFW